MRANSVSEAIPYYDGSQVRRLPVIDGHELVGVVSRADTLATQTTRTQAPLIELIYIPAMLQSRKGSGKPTVTMDGPRMDAPPAIPSSEARAKVAGGPCR